MTKRIRLAVRDGSDYEIGAQVHVTRTVHQRGPDEYGIGTVPSEFDGVWYNDVCQRNWGMHTVAQIERAQPVWDEQKNDYRHPAIITLE